ncbi:MAG: 3-hydroxyacyl-CoA dehydrogenase family protein [Bacteroidia bacterium]|nr:3-hydroxyacyl-CoA dehydrogenase family protein [Bacteroidia bacterium]
MRTLVIGSRNRIDALMRGVGRRWEPDIWKWPSKVPPGWPHYEVIVDLEADERPSPAFRTVSSALWVLSSVKAPLHRLLPDPSWASRCVGANLLPGFCERDIVEATALSDAAWERFHTWEPQSLRVPDTVGLVSARILCLILNEALLLRGEGQLTMDTLDLAVKLGLNYPYTLSEWGERIGWKHIREVVEALNAEYGASVYPIAPALRGM